MAKSYEEFKNVGSTGTDSRLESHSTDSKKNKRYCRRSYEEMPVNQYNDRSLETL